MKALFYKITQTFLELEQKRYLSKLAIILIGLSIFITDMNSQLYKEEKVIQIDALAYYTYLPAAFIYNDLDLMFFTEPGPHYEYVTGKAWISIGPDNQRIIAVSYGLAALYAPFFIAAHTFASLFDIAPYGFSWPYQLSVQIAALFYLILGLFIVRKILLKYFNETATTLTLLGVVLGTNLYYYASFEAGMSHVYNFFLISLFLLLLIRWLKSPSFLASILLGLTTGMVVLVRPSNLLIVSLFLFWDVFGWKGFMQRIVMFFKQFHKVLLMILMSFLIWVPQFLYWNFIVGQYIYFSYGDNVQFFWNDPQIINILFSYRKGWLLYTPIMAIAIMGIPFLTKYLNKTIIPVSLILAIYAYVLSCWCFWWFGGGFGSRGFIDIYGIMAIPFAAITTYFISNKKKYIKIGFMLLFILLIGHNLFEMAQYRNGAIHYANMTKASYWSSFGNLKPSGNFYNLLEEPPYDEVKRKIEEGREKEKSKK